MTPKLPVQVLTKLPTVDKTRSGAREIVDLCWKLARSSKEEARRKYLRLSKEERLEVILEVYKAEENYKQFYCMVAVLYPNFARMLDEEIKADANFIFDGLVKWSVP